MSHPLSPHPRSITLHPVSTSPSHLLPVRPSAPKTRRPRLRFSQSRLYSIALRRVAPSGRPRGRIPYARVPASERGVCLLEMGEGSVRGTKGGKGEVGWERGKEGRGEMAGDSWRPTSPGASQNILLPQPRPQPLADIPYPIRVVVGWFLRRTLARNYDEQGMARYTDQERKIFSEEAWRAVNDVLVAMNKSRSNNGAGDGEGKGSGAVCWVLGGDRPTEADASLYGMLAAVFVASANPETQETVRRFPALMEYAERIHATYFSDYRGWA